MSQGTYAYFESGKRLFLFWLYYEVVFLDPSCIFIEIMDALCNFVGEQIISMEMWCLTCWRLWEMFCPYGGCKKIFNKNLDKWKNMYSEVMTPLLGMWHTFAEAEACHMAYAMCHLTLPSCQRTHSSLQSRYMGMPCLSVQHFYECLCT